MPTDMMPDTTIRPAADANEAPLFSAPYAPPDEAIAAGLLREASRAAEAERRIDAYARHLVEGIRARAGGFGDRGGDGGGGGVPRRVPRPLPSDRSDDTQ